MDGLILVIRGEMTERKVTTFEGKAKNVVEVSTKYGFLKLDIPGEAFATAPQKGEEVVLTCGVGRLEKGEFGKREISGLTFKSIQAAPAEASRPGVGEAMGSARRAA